jgi:hypothetical protein
VGGIKEGTFKKINARVSLYNYPLYSKYLKDFDNKTKGNNKKIREVLEGDNGILYIGALIYSIQEKRKKAGYPIKGKP